MNKLLPLVSEFTTSEHFSIMNGTVKPHAEELLNYFCTHCTIPPDIQSIETTLFSMAHLNLPLAVKKDLPDLIGSFFHYCDTSGHYPAATSWKEYPSLIKPTYLEQFRDDGSVRGTTVVNRFSPTGRNEPCPCGSGKKFKKCCGQQ